MHSKCNCTYNAEHHDQAVYPKRDININESRAVYSTCMCVQEVELSEEEVNGQHQVEDDSEHCQFAAGDLQELLQIVVVDLWPFAPLESSVLVDVFLYDFLALLEELTHNGLIEWDILAVLLENPWINILFFWLWLYEFLRLWRLLFVVNEDVRSPYAKEICIVEDRDYDQADNAYKHYLIEPVIPIQIEDIEAYIQIEQWVFESELGRVGRFQICEPCSCRSVKPHKNTEHYRDEPRSCVDLTLVWYLVRLYPFEVAFLERTKIKPRQQCDYQERRYPDLYLCDEFLPEHACVTEIFEPHPVSDETDQHHEQADSHSDDHDHYGQTLAGSAAFSLSGLSASLGFFCFYGIAEIKYCQNVLLQAFT